MTWTNRSRPASAPEHVTCCIAAGRKAKTRFSKYMYLGTDKKFFVSDLMVTSVEGGHALGDGSVEDDNDEEGEDESGSDVSDDLSQSTGPPPTLHWFTHSVTRARHAYSRHPQRH
jgi:hypothetical protein